MNQTDSHVCGPTNDRPVEFLCRLSLHLDSCADAIEHKWLERLLVIKFVVYSIVFEAKRINDRIIVEYFVL